MPRLTVFRAILEAVKAFPEMDRGCPMGTGQGRARNDLSEKQPEAES